MNFIFYLFFAIIGLLLLLFVWSLRNPNRNKVSGSPSAIPRDLHGCHTAHLPQVRQALAKSDYEFVANRAPRHVLRRMQRERRRVALDYLSALRENFDALLRTARVVAVLSPEVAAVQELERLRLTVSFLWRYRIVQMSVWAGYAPMPQIDDLSNLLSGLSVRLEAVMNDLGERAALVAEMISTPDRRRIHPV